jgi:hypothetical protein
MHPLATPDSRLSLLLDLRQVLPGATPGALHVLLLRLRIPSSAMEQCAGLLALTQSHDYKMFSWPWLPYFFLFSSSTRLCFIMSSSARQAPSLEARRVGSVHAATEPEQPKKGLTAGRFVPQAFAGERLRFLAPCIIVWRCTLACYSRNPTHVCAITCTHVGAITCTHESLVCMHGRKENLTRALFTTSSINSSAEQGVHATRAHVLFHVSAHAKNSRTTQACMYHGCIML